MSGLSVTGPAEAICTAVKALIERQGIPAVAGAQAITIVCLNTAGRSVLHTSGLLDPPDPPDAQRVLVVEKVPSPYGMRVVRQHLDGVVMADQIETALVPTLVAVAAGQQVYPREFSDRLRRPALSSREKQILAMVVLNASNAEIARQLWITESGVKNHLTSAFAKLGVRSRAAATELIVDPEGGLGLGILRITPTAPSEDGEGNEAQGGK